MLNEMLAAEVTQKTHTIRLHETDKTAFRTQNNVPDFRLT